jgi:hypothetical protein
LDRIGIAQSTPSMWRNFGLHGATGYSRLFPPGEIIGGRSRSHSKSLSQLLPDGRPLPFERSTNCVSGLSRISVIRIHQPSTRYGPLVEL